MNELRDALENDEFWEVTYDRLASKSYLTVEDREELWKIRNIYKEDLIKDFMSGNIDWGIPDKIAIAKNGTNKKRIVYKYNLKIRFFLGVLYRAISSIRNEKMSKTCFSYKTGQNTATAIEYLKMHREERYKVGVKVDIHAYFNSVSRERVHELVDDIFGEYDGAHKSIENLMFDDRVQYKGQIITEWKSLIPGCALGSLFANECLSECDREFEQYDCVYARYSDDIIVLAETTKDLEKYLNIIMKYLNEYDLTMNPEKYTWFEPGDDVEYLGLKLSSDGTIDMSDHSKMKIKRQIHRWCRKGRMEIERDNADFEKVARGIVKRLNNKNFKCYINHDTAFGWCMYAFGKINTIKSLTEIDFYTRDTLRAMKTGKHNKANVKALNDEDFKSLGWVSLVDLYMLYKKDFDYYCEIIELI